MIGVGTLANLADRRALSGWLRGALAADATDLALTLAGGGAVPRAGRMLVSGIAAGGVALGAAALGTLEKE